MNTTPAVGKRNKNRFQVLNCRVQLKSNGILGVFRKEVHQLSLIDLSATGLQAISPTMIKDKKEYDVAILAPAFHHPIFAKGRLVWHHLHAGKDPRQYYRVGLEFTYFKKEFMEKIETLEFTPELRQLRYHEPSAVNRLVLPNPANI